MLLDDIIAILSDEKGSLNAALLKTKVLLHSIGKKDLATWVSNELKGYPNDENLPEYRICSAELHAHLSNIGWDAKDYVMPIMHLNEQQKKNVSASPCTMSIESIEESVRRFRTKGGRLIRHLPPEFSALFKKVLTPDTNIWSMWVEVNMVDIESIVTEVRSRLLDFMLELRDVVGIDVPEKELAAKAAGVDTEKMFATAVYGSGNTIIIGGQHIQTITNQKDDIEALLREIGKLGYQQNELEELRQAVLEDKSKNATPEVTEGKTGQWFTKALKEAGKGVVKVGVDVAASVITKAIEHYAKGG